MQLCVELDERCCSCELRPGEVSYLGLVRRTQEELRVRDPILFTYTDRDNEVMIVVSDEDFRVMVESFENDDLPPIVTSHYLYEFIEEEVACPVLAKRVLHRHLSNIRESVNTTADVSDFKWLLEQTRVVLLSKEVSEEEIRELLAWELAMVNCQTKTSQTDSEAIDISIENDIDSEKELDDSVLIDLQDCMSSCKPEYRMDLTYILKPDDSQNQSDMLFNSNNKQQNQTLLSEARDLQNDQRTTKENANESTLMSCLSQI